MSRPAPQTRPLPCCQPRPGQAWTTLVCVIVTILGLLPLAICASLPDLSPGELAERIRAGAGSIESLSVEQRSVWKSTARGGSGQAASESRGRNAVTEYRVLYRMKHHSLVEYSRRLNAIPVGAVPPEREAAYNGEFYTWLQGSQGGVSSLPNGPYNGMSYLYLRLLYYPSQEESYADYLKPPSIWHAGFEAPTLFEENMCYVLSLRAGPPGKQGATPSLCWRLVVCPRFGFATVDRQITYTSAAGAVERRGTTFRRFTEVVPGIWLPLGFESWSDDGSSADVEFRYESVNQPIGDADFVVRFPPGTIVSDERGSTRVIGVPK